MQIYNPSLSLLYCMTYSSNMLYHANKYGRSLVRDVIFYSLTYFMRWNQPLKFELLFDAYIAMLSGTTSFLIGYNDCKIIKWQNQKVTEFDLNHAIIIIILNGEIVGVLAKPALFVCM